jgi:hypothetical protein
VGRQLGITHKPLVSSGNPLAVHVLHKVLCFALLSSHFQVKPTHSLHTTTDKLSRHACTLPCPVRGAPSFGKK